MEYNGWTETREYRVWQDEDTYAVVSVDRHKNGWVTINVDGDDNPVKVRSLEWAYRHAAWRAGELAEEAKGACFCSRGDTDPEVKEECEDASRNPYDSPHGVRVQVVDMIENRELDFYEL